MFICPSVHWLAIAASLRSP